MNRKLILTLDTALIQEVKNVAEKHNITISKLIESYLMSLVKQEKPVNQEPTPLVKSLYGIASLPADFDEKSFFTEFLLEKHQLKNAPESLR